MTGATRSMSGTSDVSTLIPIVNHGTLSLKSLPKENGRVHLIEHHCDHHAGDPAWLHAKKALQSEYEARCQEATSVHLEFPRTKDTSIHP